MGTVGSGVTVGGGVATSGVGLGADVEGMVGSGRGVRVMVGVRVGVRVRVTVGVRVGVTVGLTAAMTLSCM